ncbi:hypothetical protein Hanom_Chr09g00812721 [Helianthus anomalus]
MKVLRRPGLRLRVDGSKRSGLCLAYWCMVSPKYIKRAMQQASPHMKNRPLKLFSSSRSTAAFAPCELQALRVSHLSWILCNSPFSDSFRMALDISTARGESRGKA